MPSVNETILNETILHETRLERLKNNIVRRSIAVLNKSDAALFAELTKKLETLPPESFTVQRLESLLKSVRELNAEAYKQLNTSLNTELSDFTEYEAGFQYQLFRDTLPVQVSLATVNAEQVYTAALARPFQGRLLREWMAGLETDKAVKIRDTIRTGYVNNETISQMVTRLRGTKALNYTDGLLHSNRRNVETIVRTAIGHMATFTKNRFLEANAEVIKAVEWVSTLDSRTSEPCIVRDGKLYENVTHKPIGHKLPWGGGAGAFHFNCRSSSIGVTKSWQELGFDIKDLPPSTRASMNGQVPADLKYGDWLKKQSADIQDEVLGVTRAKEFRAGKPIEKFYSDKGKFYTLEELKRIETRS